MIYEGFGYNKRSVSFILRPITDTNSLSLTPRFSGVTAIKPEYNRFSGF